MYFRLQIMDSETGVAVAALVGNAARVTPATLQRWAALVAADADNITGAKGQHVLLEAESHSTAALALARLAGVTAGGGNRGTKARARCPVCGRVYPVNKLGLISKHGKQYQKRDGRAPNAKATHCRGSGIKAKTTV